MSRQEAGHRLLEVMREAKIAVRHSLGRDIGIAKYLDSLARPDRSGELPEGFVSSRHTESIASLYRTTFEDSARDAVRFADAWLSGRCALFGRDLMEVGRPVNWGRDPFSHFEWPLGLGRSVLRRSLKRNRDLKFVWELNAHHHLLDLLKAHLITGKQRYLESAADSLLTWVEQNPWERGINWSDSMTMGVRLIVWLIILPLMSGSRTLHSGNIRRVRHSMWLQTRHIESFLSRFSSPNTHYVGEAVALFLAGLFLPDHKESSRWLKTGQTILEEIVSNHFATDGFYKERSTYYHCYAVEFYLIALCAARNAGVIFQDAVKRRVELGLEALMHLRRPDGTIPHIGDSDGGRVLKLGERSYESCNDLFCLGALLFQRPDFKHMAGSFCEEALWLLGPGSLEGFQHLDAAPPAGRSRLLGETGFAVDRTGWKSDAHWVFFGGGALGALNEGHSHSDCLGVEFSFGGRPFLVDPGTFVYLLDPGWRNAFRSAGMHNTVAVDGLSQAEFGTTFRWKSGWKSDPTGLISTPGWGLFSGRHDGYRRLPSPVSHHRTLLWRKAGYLICLDWLETNGSHGYEWTYSFAPGIHLHQDGSAVTAGYGSGVGLAFRPLCLEGTSAVEVIRGGESPGPGWYSRLYAQKTRTACLRVREWVEGVCARGFLFHPRSAENPFLETRDIRDEVKGVYDRQSLVASVLRSGRSHEIILFSPSGPRNWTWGRLHAEGELIVVSRCAEGGLQGVFGTRLLALDFSGELSLVADSPLRYLQVERRAGHLHLVAAGHASVQLSTQDGSSRWAVAGVSTTRICCGEGARKGLADLSR